ncbi:alpha-amylase family glycosyl hydrolase [Roseivirga sp.]|uniref:DUF4961 domain-containing protein n=1 Tax=Roseivirga sp. TaxID=1964215 RepID=UPI003B52E085
MIRFFLLSLFILSVSLASAQIVTIDPASATGDDEITIYYDASQGTGGLVGATKVYMHSGVVTDSPSGTDWQNVIGNWGADDGVGLMTKVDGEDDLWEITIGKPRDYYGVSANTPIFRLSMVFRNADGSAEGKGTPGNFSGGFVASNGDIYIDLVVDNFVTIQQPTEETIFLGNGETINISAQASSSVTAMSILIDEGNGFVEKQSVTSGTTINFEFDPAQSFNGSLKVTATINGEEVSDEQSLNVVLTGETQVLALPAGLKKGINYHTDQTKVSLVLEAPGKEFVFVVGDFTNWEVDANYLMNKTPDGELFWIEITGLTAQQEYVFQYWVDGTITVGDPYADKVADPWNDQYIPQSVHGAIPQYDKTDYAIATTLQTGQAEFQWNASEDSWERPAKEELVVYELLVRDFIGTHDYKDLIDTLDYIQNLGVNAIELMPVMEFEGNESWGYNPMYFFAPDKYYGTKDDLKNFIQACHERGIAVILDMVLNHAFGLNPMVRMYWDAAANKPAANSPWFNTDATHPFNVGYDFNHESTYTQNFVDSVNRYWIEEYHFDGYRFDLSKGFTQRNTPNDVSAWSSRDDSRIALLTRMANKIWEVDQNAYVILEHFADGSEETALAAEGMLLWRNMGYAYHQALGGETNESFTGATAESHVSYMESHDEQRQLYEVFNNGLSNGSYNTRDTTLAIERLKTNAAFFFSLPGPKMLWQFGELGYDIDIDFNGRVGNKPLPWGNEGLGYYEDELRQYLYDAFSAVISLRTQLNEQTNINYTYDFSGDGRSIIIDSDGLDAVIIGNFGLESTAVDYQFTETGNWYDYFEGDALDVTSLSASTTLESGYFKIYTNQQISNGFNEVVEAYQIPVTIDPAEFGSDTEITITFDATKANPDGTNGLVGADKVYMHAGIVYDDFSGTNLENIVGNLTDDGVGLMTRVSGETDQWEMTITPSTYFNITNGEPTRIGMYFRDADNTNLGKGFRGSVIYMNMELNGDLISVSPASFDQDTQITITFDARQGDRGLQGATTVYMHSGVVTDSETGTDWQNVVGNWGQNDGVGQMTQSPDNANQWTITLTPSDYYNLDQVTAAYRLAMVFRNANGSQKGAGIEGTYEWGEVTDNGDIFFNFPLIKTVQSIDDELPGFSYYPNPTQNLIQFSGEIPGRLKSLNVHDLSGQVVYQRSISDNRLEPIDLSGVDSGLYLIRVVTETKNYTFKVLVRK